MIDPVLEFAVKQRMLGHVAPSVHSFVVAPTPRHNALHCGAWLAFAAVVAGGLV